MKGSKVALYDLPLMAFDEEGQIQGIICSQHSTFDLNRYLYMLYANVISLQP